MRLIPRFHRYIDNTRRWTTGIVCFVFLALTHTTFGQGNPFDERLRGVVYPEMSTLTNFDPYKLPIWEAEEDHMFTLIYERIARYNFDIQQLEPALVETWEPAGDVETDEVRLTVRENVLWHDGQPFTAEDILFTFNYIELLDVNTLVRDKYDRYIADVSIDPDNDRVVVVTLKEPVSNPVLVLQFFWILPRHCFDERMQASDNCNLSEAPIGTGPFRLVRKRRDGNIIVQAFDQYWGKQAGIRDVMMEVFNEQFMITRRALGGNLNLIIDTDPAEIQEIQSSREFAIEQYPAFSFYGIAHNQKNELLALKGVREAITYAIDREEMLEAWYSGRGKLLGGPIVPDHPYFNPEVQPVEYNPVRARQILDGLDIIDRNRDGIRETPEGEVLEFELVYEVPKAGVSPTTQNVVQSIRDYLSNIGISVTSRDLDKDSFTERVYKNRDFDMAHMRWEFTPTYDISPLFSSDGIYENGFNITQYSSETVDGLFTQFLEAKDNDARRLTMHSVHEILAEDQPYTFLYTVDYFASIDLNILPTRIDPFYFFTYFNEWTVDLE